ncbi:fanconi-associated nuclease 1-like [Brevipalpus obovatus]|uniref:fanconi-associated nuclease 1-like n=1 Tax=Brevipalpus obovatus TaxID=246614 RepID=UPI003D9F7842
MSQENPVKAKRRRVKKLEDPNVDTADDDIPKAKKAKSTRSSTRRVKKVVPSHLITEYFRVLGSQKRSYKEIQKTKEVFTPKADNFFQQSTMDKFLNRSSPTNEDDNYQSPLKNRKIIDNTKKEFVDLCTSEDESNVSNSQNASETSETSQATKSEIGPDILSSPRVIKNVDLKRQFFPNVQIKKEPDVVVDSPKKGNSDEPDKNFIDVDNYLEIVLEIESNSPKKKIQNTDEQAAKKDQKLENFKSLVSSILEDDHYTHLFNASDWEIINKFTSMDYDCQLLYLRLLIRKPDWIRLSQIKYPDIEHLKMRLQDLVESKFLLDVESLNDLEEGLNSFDINETKKFIKTLSGIPKPAKSTKVALIEAIIKHVNSNQSIKRFTSSGDDSNTIEGQILKRLKRFLGNTCFKVDLEVSRVFLRIGLLKFPPTLHEEDENHILGQQLFDLWRIDAGELKYPSYELNKFTRVYPERENLIRFEEACRLESELGKLIQSNNFVKIIDKSYPELLAAYDGHFNSQTVMFDSTLPVFLRRFSAGHVIVRCLAHLVECLEQKKNHYEAVQVFDKLLSQDIYYTEHRGRWLERKAIILEKHIKLPDEAKKTLLEGIKDPKVLIGSGYHYALYLRAKRLGLVGKNPEKHIIPFIPEYEFSRIPETSYEAQVLHKSIEGRNNLFVSSEDDGEVKIIRVEEAALEFYRESESLRGIHCEGTVINSIFGILFWDILYNCDNITSDAFHSIYQKVPLDLNSDVFYSRRRSLIEERLQALKIMTKVEIINEIRETWLKHFNCASIVNWEKCSPDLLAEIIMCMKNTSLVAICKRLASNYKYFRSGFPDLLLWSTEQCKIKAVEVKGPGDTVKATQALWMSFLNCNDFPAEICYVRKR